MKPTRLGALLLTLGLCGGHALAQAAGDDAARTTRVALVLSGGGARGFAHVGVLKALQQLRVPVHIVTGASMGALVGGAYAAGRSVDELERLVRDTHWEDVIADRSERSELSFRRRDDDLEVPSRLEFGLGRAGLRLPPAAVGNAALESVLTQVLPADAMVRPLAALPLRFRAVATDLLSGELVELADTPLFHSLRASMAVPGVFAPIRLGGRLVVDGGLVRNLPVDLARAMGADIIIAVNVGTPLAGEEALSSAVGVTQQMLNILTEQNVTRSLRELGPRDVLIAPDLSGISFMDFRTAERAIRAGERATLAMAEQLRPYTVAPEVFALHETLRLAPRPDVDVPRTLTRLEVKSTPVADGRALAAETGLDLGQGVTISRAQAAARRLMGRGDFERVSVELQDNVQGRELILTPSDAEGARSRVRLGLELYSDFRDDHRVTVSALHLLSWVNPWGAELRTLARIGSVNGLASQWWQPLAPGSPWYGETSLGYKSETLDLFSGGRRQARATLSSRTLSLALGRQFGTSADLQIGVMREVGRGRVLIPEPLLDEPADFSETTRFMRFRYDTLNSLAFPTEGSLITAQFFQARQPSTAGATLAQSVLIAMSALRLDEWGGHVYGEWAHSRSGFAPLRLGGFLRLSGAPRDSVTGNTVMLGRMVLARRIGQMPPGLGGAVRSGISLELGEGFGAGEEIRWSRLRPAASAFISVDTRFGPAYVGVGATRALGSTVYVFLGPYW